MLVRCEQITPNFLEGFISKTLPLDVYYQTKEHLNLCPVCWNKWNIFRWDKAKGTRDYRELEEYLGSSFQEYFDSSWALAYEWNRRNPISKQEIETFYKEVPFYLYNLLIWEASGSRPKYVQSAIPFLKKHQSKVICDFGCGVGTDGLRLLDAGFKVIFCDFQNSSTDFLKWRLKKRQHAFVFVEPGEVTNFTFDTLWAMDVLEHLLEPTEIVKPLLQKGRVFIYKSEDVGKAQGRHPFHFEYPPEFFEKMLSQEGFYQDVTNNDLNVWAKKLTV